MCTACGEALLLLTCGYAPDHEESKRVKTNAWDSELMQKGSAGDEGPFV